MASALAAPILNFGDGPDSQSAMDLFDAFSKIEAAFGEVVVILATKADAQSIAVGQLTDVADAVKVALRAADLAAFRNAVGLGAVLNLAPADLPVSSATQTALNQLNALAVSTRALVDTILGGADTSVDTFVEVYRRFLADESAATAVTNALAAEVTRAKAAELLLAPLASPAFTGVPTAPTPAAGDSSTALATTEFVSRTASLAGAVLYNAAQALSLTQKIQAKRNIGAGCIGRRYYLGQPVTLTKDDIGGLVYCEATVGNLTVPLAANYTDGDGFWIYSRGVMTVQATAGDPYTFGFGDFNRSSFVMQPGDRCYILLGQDAWDVVSYTTTHGKALLADRALSFSDAEKKLLLANADIAIGHGQCRLVYVSATQIRLDPCNGNRVLINGNYYKIPNAGIVLGNANLSANTAYYIYISWDGSQLILLASVYPPALDPVSGMKVSSAYSFHVYVGKVLMNGSSQFVDALASRYVLTHYNKRMRPIRGAGGSYSTSSQSSVELSTAARAYFINDDNLMTILVGIAGNGGSGASSPGYAIYAAPALNGTDYSPTALAGNPSYGNGTMTILDFVEAGEGAHYLTVKGQTIGNYTAQFNGSVVGMVMM